jgi:hypothetical protein
MSKLRLEFFLLLMQAARRASRARCHGAMEECRWRSNPLMSKLRLEFFLLLMQAARRASRARCHGAMEECRWRSNPLEESRHHADRRCERRRRAQKLAHREAVGQVTL